MKFDWKYALGLELADPGFDFSVLSEFRSRLLKYPSQGRAEQRLLDTVLALGRERGWLKARGKQRTDSTHVLAAIHALNRLENAGETLRHALDVLAAEAPEWLLARMLPEWGDRYGKRFENYRLPREEARRKALAATVGRDGRALLQAVYAPEAPPTLRQLPAVQVLRQVWLQQFVAEDGVLRWRDKKELPPALLVINSPYDAEARYSKSLITGIKRETVWTGYKVHLTETCDPDLPRLITDVHTTVATTQDVSCTADIQQSLADRGLLPGRHLVDTGYVDAQLLVDSQRRHGVELFGPTRLNPSWQAREGGYDQYQFAVDWEKERVTCPEGKVSVSWDTEKAKGGSSAPGGRARLLVGFISRDCAACPSRALCVRSATGRPRGRGLVLPAREDYEALQQARTVLGSEEGRAEYRRRAGIEGTLSQGVRRCDLRRARYRGLQKTHLQHMATAAGINALRAIRYLDGVPLAPTRRSRFARLRA